MASSYDIRGSNGTVRFEYGYNHECRLFDVRVDSNLELRFFDEELKIHEGQGSEYWIRKIVEVFEKNLRAGFPDMSPKKDNPFAASQRKIKLD